MNKQKKSEMFRSIPSVDELVNSAKGKSLEDIFGRSALLVSIRTVLDKIRKDAGRKGGPEDFSAESILRRAEKFLENKNSPSLREAVNATGIILHTGLGRAVLPPSAVGQINSAIKGYCTLAVDAETGQRGSREEHVKHLVCELTGAEDATVVNNNAAATILILNTLAGGREVIVSRGQLIEIGGSFRMPEIMEASGVILRETGTTNKTHLKDYASAIGEKTGAILHVHHSNYRIMGFAEEPSVGELVQLAGKHKLPVIDDLGSGALVSLEEYGLQPEPLVTESIRKGVSVICFSGDKLIGGPQSGIIAGKAEFIGRIRKNPLARAFRVDKMSIAGLEATLKLFLNPEKLKSEHPVYRMFSLSPEELDLRAQRFMGILPASVHEKAEISVVKGFSLIGSGSAPVEALPSKLLSVKPCKISAEDLARKLRYNNPPVFTRIHKGSVLLDLRTMQEEEEKIVAEALSSILC